MGKAHATIKRGLKQAVRHRQGKRVAGLKLHALPQAGRKTVRAQRRIEAMKFTRITVDPAQMGGVPCIRGLRIPVATVVGLVADGMAEAEILKAYPDLTAADIREALKYAAEAVRERELPLAAP
jgi:uncharacterized protein (DUF433 family)